MNCAVSFATCWWNWCLSVIEANSVDEAVALLSSVEDISMVLSDIRLEGGATGLELMEKIKPGFRAF